VSVGTFQVGWFTMGHFWETWTWETPPTLSLVKTQWRKVHFGGGHGEQELAVDGSFSTRVDRTAAIYGCCGNGRFPKK